MNLYLLGLALFFLPHLVPLIRPLRAAIVGRMGENPWKMTMTVLSFAGIALIAWGRPTSYGTRSRWAARRSSR
jgi:uncharacterized membrane protein